jgi:hypothetical protein
MNPQKVALWIIAGAAALIAAATIISTIVHVARGRSRPWSREVIIAVLFHAGLALVALRAAIGASGAG